jgi:hypothetical protein
MPTSDDTTVKKRWASVKTISAAVNIANEMKMRYDATQSATIM